MKRIIWESRKKWKRTIVLILRRSFDKGCKENREGQDQIVMTLRLPYLAPIELNKYRKSIGGETS